jgi:hypothetical protein
LVYVSVAGLEIIKVADAGNLQKERVIMRMGESASLINFLLINSNSAGDSGQVRDLNDHVFWFPDKVVSQGDYVRLYTRAGEVSTQAAMYQGKPATFHNLFWRKKNPVWGGTSNAVVIFRVQTWVAQKVL